MLFLLYLAITGLFRNNEPLAFNILFPILVLLMVTIPILILILLAISATVPIKAIKKILPKNIIVKENNDEQFEIYFEKHGMPSIIFDLENNEYITNNYGNQFATIFTKMVVDHGYSTAMNLISGSQIDYKLRTDCDENEMSITVKHNNKQYIYKAIN